MKMFYFEVGGFMTEKKNYSLAESCKISNESSFPLQGESFLKGKETWKLVPCIKSFRGKAIL